MSEDWTEYRVEGVAEGLVFPAFSSLDQIFPWAFKRWILPEITRRQAEEGAPTPYELARAQVVLNVDRPPEVRLNDDVRGKAVMRSTRAIAKDEVVYEDDVDDLSEVDVSETDPNAAHITVLLHKGRWLVAFDFRYNAARIAEHIAAAQEFLAAAESELLANRMRPFAELLLAAIELMAKAWLMTLPIEKLLTAKTHDFVAGLYNWWGKEGNTDPAYPSLLNHLRDLRKSARFLGGDFHLTGADGSGWLATARRMEADLVVLSAHRDTSDLG